MIGVPTNWQQMRYCIVAALAYLGKDGDRHPADREDIYTDAIQFHIGDIFGGPDCYIDWDMNSRYGKALDRAMESLREDGTVSYDDFGYRLTKWGETRS